MATIFLYLKKIMAKIETDRILGSSKDNFLVFSNPNPERPFVTFYFNQTGNPVGRITIKDALDDDGYSKVINYSPEYTISDSSFRCTSDRTSNTFGLIECLKLNNIFYDISLVQDIPNVGILVKAYIDSSTRYSIVAGSILVVGGSYSTYVPHLPNKFVLLENTPDGQISLEKYSYGEDVSFNVTAPFEHLSFKDPFNVKLLAYKSVSNVITQEGIANSNITVFPTTLRKFDDTNLSDYYIYYSGLRVNFLTNNLERDYNIGETVALSVMTDKPGIGIIKRYYTQSGQFINMESSVIRAESKTARKDFYFRFEIDNIERASNKQVGYCTVVANEGGTELTYPVRYNVIPKCNQNNVIFFVNEIGGIDSYNFLGERVWENDIDDQSTYFKNPVKPFTTLKEIEAVSQKVVEEKHQLKTTIIDERTAKWLNELTKSKYCFTFDGNVMERIIIDDFNIEVSDRNNTFEVELTYHSGDNKIAL